MGTNNFLVIGSADVLGLSGIGLKDATWICRLICVIWRTDGGTICG